MPEQRTTLSRSFDSDNAWQNYKASCKKHCDVCDSNEHDTDEHPETCIFCGAPTTFFKPECDDCNEGLAYHDVAEGGWEDL